MTRRGPNYSLVTWMYLFVRAWISGQYVTPPAGTCLLRERWSFLPLDRYQIISLYLIRKTNQLHLFTSDPLMNSLFHLLQQSVLKWREGSRREQALMSHWVCVDTHAGILIKKRTFHKGSSWYVLIVMCEHMLMSWERFKCTALTLTLVDEEELAL